MCKVLYSPCRRAFFYFIFFLYAMRAMHGGGGGPVGFDPKAGEGPQAEESYDAGCFPYEYASEIDGKEHWLSS